MYIYMNIVMDIWKLSNPIILLNHCERLMLAEAFWVDLVVEALQNSWMIAYFVLVFHCVV